MTNTHIYINGLGIVSPQKAIPAQEFLDDPVSYQAVQMKCVDPGYKDFIPAEQIRRMGRIIKMGVAAARICLKDVASVQELMPETSVIPEAIITGTGLGCIEDTEKFLASMIKNHEEFLTPTSFIQSTHNTVAGQIALLLKCHGYNFTYVHRGISFESALLDAMLQLKLHEVENVLVGGLDEITQDSLTITGRMGFWKRKPIDTLRLAEDTQRGSVAGEGAAFMFLENKKHSGTYAELKGLTTFMKPESIAEQRQQLNDFLVSYGLTTDDISLVLSGISGDPATDHYYADLSGFFSGNTHFCYFKHLCGEYHTASSFGIGIAATLLRMQEIPGIIKLDNYPPENFYDRSPVQHLPGSAQFPAIRNILIYNHFMGKNHSFTLLSQP